MNVAPDFAWSAFSSLHSLSCVSKEGEGFEPPETCASAVFKTAALNRSAIPPNQVRTMNDER